MGGPTYTSFPRKRESTITKAMAGSVVPLVLRTSVHVLLCMVASPQENDRLVEV